MTKKELALKYSTYLLVVIYISWFVVFESMNLPLKIDTHIHVFRVMNLIESFKQGILFPSWHDSPYWGYPEDYNFFLSYLFTSLLGLILPIAISFKLGFLFFYWLAAVSCDWCVRKIFEDKSIAFMSALLYIGSASFANFGLGSGSLPRVAAFAFFPLMLGTFIEWWRSPTEKSTLIASLVFFLAYLAHPFAAIAGCLSIILIPFFVESHQTIREHLSQSWKWFLLGSFLFAWPLGHLLFAKSLSSWDEVYRFYAQFKLFFYLKSFFAFWLDNSERTKLYYMGSLPLIISLVGSIYLARKHKLSRSFLFMFCLTFIGFIIVLFGQEVVNRNAYRFDLIFNLGVSACAAFILSQIKWRPVIAFVILLIILDQTFYFRTFGGKSYVEEKEVQDFKSQHNEGMTAKRVNFDHINPNLVMTRTQFKQLSTSNWMEYHGVLEVTPYNLGFIPFDQNIKNRKALFQLLGIPGFFTQKASGAATVYSRFLYIEANSRRESYEQVYAQLLKEPLFNSYEMPLVFKQTHSNSIVLKDQNLNVIVDLTKDQNWKTKVYDFFKDNQKEEFFSPLDHLPQGKLIVIKEAAHLRRGIYSEGHQLKDMVVEPGLIGLVLENEQAGKTIEIQSQFTSFEKLLGLMSLLALLLIFFKIVKRRNT